MSETPDCTSCSGCPSEEGPTAVGRRDLLATGVKLGALATVTSLVRGIVGIMPGAAATVKRRAVVKTSKVPVGSAYAFRDPYTEAPAYVLQPKKGHFVALSRVCPHMGCTVGYTSGHFVCPCHGSEFTATGALLHGPATRGLTALPLSVSDGQIYIES